jgi:hypothetical protein
MRTPHGNPWTPPGTHWTSYSAIAALKEYLA